MPDPQKPPTTTDMERWFGENLRTVREQQEISQTGLARMMAEAGFSNFHQSTVARIEAGERPVRLSEGLELSVILGTPIGSLTWPPARLSRLNRFLHLVHEARSRYVGIETLTQEFNRSIESLTPFLADIEKLIDDGVLGEDDLPQDFDVDLRQVRQLVRSRPEDAVAKGRAQTPKEPTVERFVSRTFGPAEPGDTARDPEDELVGRLRALNERIQTAQATPEDVLRRQILELLLDPGVRTADEIARGLPELVDQLKIVNAAREFKAERDQYERDKLIREVGNLRGFEREYRQRLESWLLELGDAAAFRDYSEAREIIEEGLREVGSVHGTETSDG